MPPIPCAGPGERQRNRLPHARPHFREAEKKPIRAKFPTAPVLKGEQLLEHAGGLGALERLLDVFDGDKPPQTTAGTFVRRSNGEQCICPRCSLPVGDYGYPAARGECDNVGSLLHGECKAELLQEARLGDVARAEEASALKKAHRAKYDIGWKTERIPRNPQIDCASQLACQSSPHSMYCLVLQEDGPRNVLTVAPTASPAAAINLEYLSLALRVRKGDGKEPIFSLDPKPDGGSGGLADLVCWQVKRFEPEWLAGTSIGEIMFQADYHLKELSMGEHSQPVVGMKSCFDLLETEEWQGKAWSAREWFVMKSAEMRLTPGGALIPHVRLGVEAREQVQGPHGMQDVPITKEDHPLVQYAEAFTHYFDLIAERKSVVYYLRELAKASVLAKYLVESGAKFDESLLGGCEVQRRYSHPQVPQLWNERSYNKLQVKDGEIADTGKTASGAGVRCGLYGGVQFGLERVSLSATPVRASVGGFAVERVSLSAATTVRPSAGGAAVAVSSSGLLDQLLSVVEGVDLNLDRFNLSVPQPIRDEESYSRCWGGEAFVGRAFWSSIEGRGYSNSMEEDNKFLRALFNPHLSDRRDEGELFVPPDPSPSNVRHLRDLLAEELKVSQARNDRFFCKTFALEDTSTLFRSAVAQCKLPSKPLYSPCEMAVARGGEIPFSGVTPVVSATAEDGTIYRAYRAKGLEVRTSRPYDGEEVVGAVFQSRSSIVDVDGCEALGDEEIVKATEYVEKGRQYYVLLETEGGHLLVCQLGDDGAAHLAADPEDLEARNLLAKVLRASQTAAPRARVSDVMASGQVAVGTGAGSGCQYARAVYDGVLAGRRERAGEDLDINDIWG